MTQESLRAAIGMVTQDTSLLHRSIAANIRYGRPGASDAEVEAAARKAQAHEFIVACRTGTAAPATTPTSASAASSSPAGSASASRSRAWC